MQNQNNRSETVEAISNFLFIGLPENELKTYDLLIVLGNEQIQETIEEICWLIKEKHISEKAKIMFTGNVGSLNKGQPPEAKRLQKAAIEQGIPETMLLPIEDKATNTLENFRFSKPIIEEYRNLDSYNRILCVCKAFLCRRAKMCASACSFPLQKLDFYGTVSGKKIAADTWHLSEDTTKRVMEELKRIAEYTLKGDLSLE